MFGTFRRRNCKCPPERKRCNCGAKWTYRYHIIDTKTGKRKQKETRGFSTKEEVEAEAKRILTELQQGTYIEEKDITFNKFSKQWLATYEKSGKVKQSTIDIRKSKLKHMESRFGEIKIKDISKLIYQEFINDMAKKYARKTVASIHEVGQLIFKKAVELEVISKDITEYTDIPRKMKTVEDLENETEIPRYLERDELIRFLGAAKESYRAAAYPIFTLLAYTGMRIGELCALKWKDVNTDEQTISITKTLYKYTLQTPKSISSHRTIDVDGTVINVLKEHRKAQKVVSIEKRDDQFIFVNGKGGPMSSTHLENVMKSLLKEAGITHHLTPHSLRHTHTSLLAEAGVSLEVIQHRLGHQSDKITRNIYLHVTKPKKKEASAKFSELMGGS